MIDFDIYEDSDANKPRRRRRSSSKKRVSFGHREFLDAKENLVNVEQITPLKQSTPPVRRASRAVLAHIGGAKAKLFSAVTPAARRRRPGKRDAAAAEGAAGSEEPAVTPTPRPTAAQYLRRRRRPRHGDVPPSPPPAAPVPDRPRRRPPKSSRRWSRTALRRAGGPRHRAAAANEATRSSRGLLMACPALRLTFAPADGDGRVEIEQPESPGPPTARRVFAPRPAS